MEALGFAFPLSALVLSGACVRETRPNLLVITADTLRADALAAYRTHDPPRGPDMPATDRLAERGGVLSRCYAVSPRTTQSLGSFMTGLHPTGHGAFGLFHTMPAATTMLAELLSKSGYRTLAVVTNYFLERGRGFEQGFETYDDLLIEEESETADRVTDRAILQMSEPVVEPWFLWVHYLDPHWPYDPPESVVTSLDPSYDRPFTLFEDVEARRVTRGSVIFQNAMDEVERRHVELRYAAETRVTDRHLSRLMDALDARGLLANTLVVFYSDHGETMGKHDNYYAHGEDLYEGAVRIPAFLHLPGVVPAERFDGLVSSVDFLPTILDALDIQVPAGLDGVSLLPAMTNGGEWPRDTAFMESDYQLIHPENPRHHLSGPAGKWRAVVSGAHKLIHVPGDPEVEWELYDVIGDPGERENLVDERLDVRRRLERALAGWEGVVDAQTGRHADVDSEAARLLRSLGYLN